MKKFAVIIIVALTLYQLVRVIVFVNTYGGLEHDGGWLLGVSRSLAERGTFTTMVSTLPDPTITAGRNVDGKFDIQDAAGRIWFYTANSVGPLVFAVNAFFLRILGVNFWSLHVGSLLFFAAYLGLAALLLWRAQNWLAVLVFHLYLFLYPHLSIFLSYEALGEMPGMACLLLAFILFAHTLQREAGPTPWLVYLTGLVIGLTLNTKLITLLSFGGMGLLWLWLWGQGRITLRDTLILGAGVLTLPALWELIQLLTITSVAGFDLYQQNAWGRLDHFLNEGSGIGGQNFDDNQFFWDKLLLIREMSHPAALWAGLTLAVVALAGPALMWLQRGTPRQLWTILVWGGWLGNFIWFTWLSKTGWVRHGWFELILGVLVISLVAGEMLQQGRAMFQPEAKNRGAQVGYVLAGLTLLIILIPGFLAQRQAATLFITPELVEAWRQKQIEARYARVPWMITPRAEQERVVEFLRQLPEESRIFYPANHKAAEIAVQLGRVFYPVERRAHLDPGPNDVVIVGITLISPWKDPGIRQSIIQRTRAECPNLLYQSDYYIICQQ